MIDLASLEQLAARCRDLLLAHPDPENVANTYLHPLNAHPSSLQRYSSPPFDRWAVRNRIRNSLAGAVVQLQGLGSAAAASGDVLPERADVLFISHLLQPSQAVGGQDLYFGEAPKELDLMGVRTVTALINHTGHNWPRLGRQWRPEKCTRVVLARRLGMTSEVVIGHRLSVAGRRLRKDAPPAEPDFARQVRNAAAMEATSTGSRTALRIGMQIEMLVRRLQPRMIVTTYEGHSWERLAFFYARQAQPDIVCVGYHHALLFPATSAMTQQLGNGFDPEFILTAGSNTSEWLRSQPSLQGISIGTLGSVRVPKISGLPQVRKASRTCLIIPEGTPSESTKLISVAADAARKMPQLTFHVRLHPVLRPETIQGDPALRNLPTNVTWSDASLEHDLETSRWALYRGSTAVISAALAGLRPIYLDDGGVVIDPLAALDTWRANIADAKALADVLKDDLSTDDSARQAGFEKAAAYCRKCYTDFELPVLQSLIPPR